MFFICFCVMNDCVLLLLLLPPPQGQDNIYDDPYQPEMDQPQAPSAGRRRAYYRNRDHFATIRTASLVRILFQASFLSLQLVVVVLCPSDPYNMQTLGLFLPHTFRSLLLFRPEVK